MNISGEEGVGWGGGQDVFVSRAASCCSVAAAPAIRTSLFSSEHILAAVGKLLRQLPRNCSRGYGIAAAGTLRLGTHTLTSGAQQSFELQSMGI